MGTKRKKAFSGHFALSNSQPRKKRQAQLVEAGKCRECGNALGRAKTICNTCADKARVAEAARREADKAAAQKEAEKNSPLLAPSELQALPQLATGKEAIKAVKVLTPAPPSLYNPALLRRVRGRAHRRHLLQRQRFRSGEPGAA
jgi:hypothetical protein